ncbi:regulator of nonsense transcripts 2-like [Homalodisca vitripennis]|uniref:regulator of nonsense transcripts 2-like n=1 Tax=Homalodisca vitripennis TaxID=197043 RepID=UPI001EEAC0CA|nr:regulator of nonsense transcripts 2-like [Homalodisca vitripennis]
MHSVALTEDSNHPATCWKKLKLLQKSHLPLINLYQDQVNIESKKKTVKFIGELVNFGVYAKKEVLRALKLLLYDFTHHNIEMVCCLLETCGCVLYAASDTHLSIKYYLEQMMRLKTIMALDSRYVILIENAYYHILPPENTVLQPPVQLTPLQHYISKTIYSDLMEPNSETMVLTVLRSLDWESEETAAYTVQCLTKAFNIGYSRIRALASVVSMLTDYQEEGVCCVVDGVLEDIRLGMEVNKASMNQRRVAMIKYLGELYNYRLLDTADILRVLYSMLSFEMVQEQSKVVCVDPPTSIIRLHLILLLLNTCAFPLSNQEIYNKLKYFCTYFQHYYWMKRSSPMWSEERPFPTDLIYRFEDVIFSICSEFTLAKDLEEANDFVTDTNIKLCSEMARINPDYVELLATVFEEDEDDSEDVNEDEDVSKTKSESQVKLEKKEESEDDFIQEYNKIITESLKTPEINKHKTKTEISLPLGYKKLITDGEPQFVLLFKKGNKQLYKPLKLPPDHEFFAGLKSGEEAIRKENAKFKRLTLDINERLQDEI